jgi:hypothetical protein
MRSAARSIAVNCSSSADETGLPSTGLIPFRIPVGSRHSKMRDAPIQDLHQQLELFRVENGGEL